MTGTLYIVATPIGNLQDMTARAIETLRIVDVIACEDTRHTQNLLNHFRISTPTISYHQHNEEERAGQLVVRLLAGESVAVVSDAGTPGINDPGLRIVARAHEANARVISIPGPVAFAAAVAASGIAADSIFFGGFLPSKKGERIRRLEELRSIPATLVFYEAPHRIANTLSDCLDVLGNREAAIARELTKIHEEIRRASLSNLLIHFSDARARGEIVLIIERSPAAQPRSLTTMALATRVNEIEAAGEARKTALKQAAKEFGISKSEAYRTLETAKK